MSNDRFNPPPFTAATNIESYIFVQIGEEQTADNVGRPPLKLHSGIENPLAKGDFEGKWDNFIGVANFLALSPVRDSTRTSSNGFRILLRFPPEARALGIVNQKYDESRAALIRLAHNVDAADLPVCVWQLEINTNKPKKTRPRTVILGHISQPQITHEALDIYCYTAGKLLDRAWGVPVIWNDFHQNDLNPRIKNEDGSLVEGKQEDGSFRFSNKTAAELGAEFP